MVVWIVMTDSHSRGGSIYTIKSTKEEAIAAALGLYCCESAIVLPWKIGSEACDSDYQAITFGKAVYGYDSFTQKEIGNGVS